MQTVELRLDRSTNGVIATRVWRELGRLALEGMIIGVAFSILLAAAVYMIARNVHDDALYTTRVSPAVLAMITARRAEAVATGRLPSGEDLSTGRAGDTVRATLDAVVGRVFPGRQRFGRGGVNSALL